MKFIKFTGSKPTSGAKGSTSYRQHGIFECPICLSHIERNLSIGKRNKTCGNKECRKTAGNFRGALTPREVAPITTNPYYTNLNSMYKQLNADESISISPLWDKMSNFFKDTIEYYTSFRSRYRGLRISYSIPDKSIPVSTGNFELIIYTREYTKVKKYSPKVGAASSYLYILECQGLYKIGIADDIAKRVKNLKTGNPFTINVISSKYVVSARTLEAYLHMLYKDKAHSGEWFNLSKEDVEDIENYLEDGVGSDGVWSGDSILIRQSIVTQSHSFNDTTVRESNIRNTYTSHLKGPTEVTEYVYDNVALEVPSNMKYISKTKHSMYQAWRTMITKSNKGFTMDPLWKDFYKFVEDMEIGYSSISVPVLVVSGNHYDKNTASFIERSAFSSKLVPVIAYRESSMIGTFKSIQHAAESLDCISGHIVACCKGTRKSHNGFVFQYLDKQ